MNDSVARSWVSSLALMMCAPVFACPPDSTLDTLLEHKALVIGEIHGTVETPAFFQCLVERALVSIDEPLTVSLELASSARDPSSSFWSGEDGRSSQAMWQLVQFLKEQEQLGKLSLHLQLEKPVFNSFEEAKAYSDDWERHRGIAIKELAARGRVIALMGNAHSMRDPGKFEGIPGELFMAGYYMGSEVTRVAVENVEDGEAWVCKGIPPAITCGAVTVKKRGIAGAVPGAIVNGDAMGHDLIYFIEERAFSASPPHLQTTSSDERSPAP